jgi:hypothetical protein
MSDAYTGTCPVCHGMVGKQSDGTLFPHQCYADGAGPGPDQSHEMADCGATGLDAEGHLTFTESDEIYPGLCHCARNEAHYADAPVSTGTGTGKETEQR